ncbi:hypothetical protein [Paraburkholderia phymatum]|uniref:hypothetical protein n=1 Tax=Paraburkholderia phymatum TaxID=148447 RepID=UPI003D691867
MQLHDAGYSPLDDRNSYPTDIPECRGPHRGSTSRVVAAKRIWQRVEWRVAGGCAQGCGRHCVRASLTACWLAHERVLRVP